MTLHLKPINASPSPGTVMKPVAAVGGGYTEWEPSGGKPLRKMLEQVMLQVEYHCFADLRRNFIDPLYKELCLIIAEVLVLNPDSFIKINGSDCRIGLVQEAYSQINKDHVRLVYNNIHNVLHRIYNKKAYLRTALYNAVFEIESHYINDMLCD